MNADRILRAALACCQSGTARSQIESVTYASDYGEPGYQLPNGKHAIAFGNWNTVTRYTERTRKFETVDDTPKRFGDALEHAGYELEWSDEWTTCSACGLAVRTSGDSYGWKRAYVEIDGEISCEDCTLRNPEEYLRSLEGNADRAVTLRIDPSEYGYVKWDSDRYQGNFQNGLHGGQNDSPQVIAKSLRAAGIDRFIFVIDDVGQFDVRFSLYVHADESDNMPAHLDSALPYDPATEMGKALRGEPTEHYTVTTRQLTPEEFISGNWRKP